jgi:hypothetical protein
MTGDDVVKRYRMPRKAGRLSGALLLAASWGAMSWSLPALAQQVPSVSTLPGAVQPGRDRPQPIPPTQPDFDFSIEAPQRSPVGRAVDDVHFVLKDIKISGAHTLSADSFRELYEKLLG